MANYIATDTDLVVVADAIRAKSGGSSSLTFPSGFVSEIQSIPTGGGGGVAPNDVNFLDYDGTIVASYSAADFANLSALPSNPSHTGLTAQGWNYTLAAAKTYVATNGKLDVGQMYITDDGKTRLYITIAAPGRMTVPLYWSQTVANGVTIDWGDESATETFAGTGNLNTTHTYAAIGDYVITLNPEEGCTLGFGNGSNTTSILGGGNWGCVYQNMLKNVEIGAGVTSIGDYAFNNCYSLSSIIIPQGVTSIGIQPFYDCYSLSYVVIPQGLTTIGASAFYECYALSSVVIPQSVTTIDSMAFYHCYTLSSIVIPSSVTSIGSQVFYNCYSLSSIIIPQGVTSIGNSAIRGCYALASIVIPQGLTNIGNYTFHSCYGMALYDFTACTSVPIMSSTNAFQSIPTDCIILVPASLYDTWKAATNWATYASQIQPDGPVGYSGTITNTGYIDFDITAIDGTTLETPIPVSDSETVTATTSVVLSDNYYEGTVDSNTGCTYTITDNPPDPRIITITPTANNWTFVYNCTD